MIFLINACAREESRTLPLARKAAEQMNDSVQILDLYEEGIVPLDRGTLAKRLKCIAEEDYSDPMFRYAKQFKDADTIVIAAPYWDLSFPSILKCWVEQICVLGLTFQYGEDDCPYGLCHAEKLIYVTTAGGLMMKDDHGFEYIRQVFSEFFGIRSAVLIKAEGLDLHGADPDGILKKAEEQISELLHRKRNT